MVRRCKADDINFLVVQQLADVSIGLNLLAQIPVFLHLPVEDVLVHVAQSNHPRPFDLAQACDVTHSAPIKSDHGETDVAVGASRVRGGGRAGFALLGFLGAKRGEQAQGSRGEEGGLEEAAAVELIHIMCGCSVRSAASVSAAALSAKAPY